MCKAGPKRSAQGALRGILEEHGAITHDEIEARMAAIKERLTKDKEAKTREM